MPTFLILFIYFTCESCIFFLFHCVRLFEDLELASGQMDEGKLKDNLFDKMALSSEVEKSKEEVLVVSVEKEKLRMDLMESKNNMLLLQSKLDAAQLESAAVQAAVLSIEIQKLTATIKQYKEQAHISATEKKGLMNDIESIKAESAAADARNKRIRELTAEKDDLFSKLYRSTAEANLTRNKMESLQADISDLYTRLSSKDEEIKFFKNAAFANTKKNESEKADLQVKLSIVQVKLETALNRIETISAEKDKNFKKADEDIKGLNKTVSTLETQLDEASQKSSAAVGANIASAIKNKKDQAVLIESLDAKEAELFLFKKQSTKTVLTMNNLSKLMTSIESQAEMKCKALQKKLIAGDGNFKIIKSKFLQYVSLTTAATQHSATLSQEIEEIKSQLSDKTVEFEKREMAYNDLQTSSKDQKSECFKARIELENSRKVIESLKSESVVNATVKNKAIQGLQKEIDIFGPQLTELKAENARLEAREDMMIKCERADKRIEELLGQLKVAEEWQSSIGQEVIKLQSTADETAEVRYQNFIVL